MLGPAFDDLRPFARNLDELNALDPAARRAATPVLENEIRPFVRAARKPGPRPAQGRRRALGRDAAA